ncbi:MAG: hypothetical protein ACJA1Z_000568 [Patiriisocius sp.]|jgi:hypothetical protein
MGLLYTVTWGEITAPCGEQFKVVLNCGFYMA